MIIKNQQDVTPAVLSELERAQNPRFRKSWAPRSATSMRFAREVKLTEEEFHQAAAYYQCARAEIQPDHNEVI